MLTPPPEIHLFTLFICLCVLCVMFHCTSSGVKQANYSNYYYDLYDYYYYCCLGLGEVGAGFSVIAIAIAIA